MKHLSKCSISLNDRKLSLFPSVTLTVFRKTVLLLLVFLAFEERCAGYSLFKMERRSIWLREVQEYENASIEIGCSEEVWACVSTPFNLFKYGDPAKGEDVIRNGFFKDLCRSLKEFEQCAEDHNAISDPKCADVALRVSKIIPTVCDNPIVPILEKLQTCINSHYDEVMFDFPSRHDAVITEQATDRNLFCSLYKQLVDETVALFKTCPNTQTLWTAANENTFRKNFYPLVFPRPMPFQCIGR